MGECCSCLLFIHSRGRIGVIMTIRSWKGGWGVGEGVESDQGRKIKQGGKKEMTAITKFSPSKHKGRRNK